MRVRVSVRTILFVTLLSLVSAPWWAAGPSAAAPLPALPRAGQAVAQADERLCPVGQPAPLPWGSRVSIGSTQLLYNLQGGQFQALGLRYGNGQVQDWSTQEAFAVGLTASGQVQGEKELGYFDGQPGPLEAAYASVSGTYLTIQEVPGARHIGDERYPFLAARWFNAQWQGPARWLPWANNFGRAATVAYNPDDDEFFLVWQDDLWPLGPTPTPFPPNPTVTPTPSPIPTEGTPSPTRTPSPLLRGLYGQRVRADHPTDSARSELILAQTPEEPVTPTRIVYNSQAKEYLVVGLRGGGLVAVRVGRDGLPIGAPVALPETAHPDRLFLAYNSADNQYLLVWSAARSADSLSGVMGLVLQADLSYGTPFFVVETPAYDLPTGLVYNPTRHEYLLAWLSAVTGPARGGLMRLSPTGEALGLGWLGDGGVYGLGVTPTGDYLALTRDGQTVQPFQVGTTCAATPTAEPTSSPTPGLRWPPLEERVGTLVQVHTSFWGDSVRAAWYVRFTSPNAPFEGVVPIPYTGWIDERLARAQVGATVWLQGRDINGQFLADLAVVVPPGAALPPPPPANTPTPTPQFPACWLGGGTGMRWPDGVNPSSLSLAYNGHDDEYAAVTVQNVTTTTHAILGARLDADASILATPTAVVTEELGASPVLAFSPTANRYLLVWGRMVRDDQGRGQGSRLMAQTLAPDLTPLGPPVELAGLGNHSHPALTYNPDDDEFLVVWVQTTPIMDPRLNPAITPIPGATLPAVYQAVQVQRVGSDGGLRGVTLTLDSVAPFQGEVAYPRLAYNAQRHEYLGAAVRDGQLVIRRLSRTGALLGETVHRLPTQYAYAADLVFNPTANEYLALWLGFDEPGQAHLTLARLSADGEVAQTSVLDTGSRSREVFAAVFNARAGEYALATRDMVYRLGPDLSLRDGQPRLELGIAALGVSEATGTYLVAHQNGWLLQVLGTGVPCGARPTETPGPSPTAPSPPAILEWEGALEAVVEVQAGAEWTVGGQTVLVTPLTRVATAGARIELGARVRVTAREVARQTAQTTTRIADAVLVLPPVAATPAPTATATPTATPTPTATVAPDPRSFTLFLPLVQRSDLR